MDFAAEVVFLTPERDAKESWLLAVSSIPECEDQVPHRQATLDTYEQDENTFRCAPAGRDEDLFWKLNAHVTKARAKAREALRTAVG